ncbi:hypothetical protein AAMO2058_000152800 [Amorphochlora amoebiformis]
MCIWADYVHSFQYGERWLAVWVVFWVHLVGTWTSCGVFKLAEYMGFWQKYRLPRDRPDMDPNLPQNRKRDRWAIFEQVLGTVLFVPMFIYLVFPYMQLAGVEIATEIPGIRKLSLDIVIMILGCDTLFYWIHRGFHHPLLYRFHKKHHEYKATNVWASEYFDPLDLVANILPGVLPGVLIQTHFITLMAFTLIRSWQSVNQILSYHITSYHIIS